MRSTYRRTAALAVVAALLISGCTAGGDATGSGATTTIGSDALVLLKPEATDLQALDLRDKLLPQPGVAGVVYDQAVKRLRIDFTDSATAEQKAAARDLAAADPAVQRVRVEGEPEGVSQAPAPS